MAKRDRKTAQTSKKLEHVDLNTGHRFAISGSPVRGYVVKDTEADDSPEVFRSYYVQDCYDFRNGKR